jgi:mannose/cellobiose epimerase-like protein (N-acyl-D-glucosamine 2-epimerase family)
MKCSLVGFLFLLWSATASAYGQEAVSPGQRWIDHAIRDLMPFWMSEQALGKPTGAFPSVRCDDGTVYNPHMPCAEIGPNRPPNERYVNSISRQSFGYGVAFHLTGERKYLDAMKAGIDFIRQNAMDRTNGGWRRLSILIS